MQANDRNGSQCASGSYRRYPVIDDTARPCWRETATSDRTFASYLNEVKNYFPDSSPSGRGLRRLVACGSIASSPARQE